MTQEHLVLLSQRLGPVTELESSLARLGARIEGAPLWTLEDIRANGASARVIILGAVEPFDAAALESLPALQAIVRRGVGTDNVDLDAATRLGIVVAHVTDASVEEVSDHALALLLAAERRVHLLDRAVRAGAWVEDPAAIIALRAPMRRMSTLTLGIVGFGRIGQALARKAGGLYRRVLASDPAPDRSAADRFRVELVALEELLEHADHLSVHTPLMPGTRHLIGREAINALRPGAVLVNTSRGGVVDQEAVLDAVRAGTIAGAGLDVTEGEPIPLNDPLVGEARLLLTAHSAAYSQTADVELARRSVEAVASLLADQRPESIANPKVLTSAVLRQPLGRSA